MTLSSLQGLQVNGPATFNGKLTANNLFFSAGVVSSAGVLSNTNGYVGMPTCSVVSTGVYNITFPSAHPFGNGNYITNLCGTDGYWLLKGIGVNTSTVLYVRVLDGNNSPASSGFTYIVL
jgi:hypothetical protein